MSVRLSIFSAHALHNRIEAAEYDDQFNRLYHRQDKIMLPTGFWFLIILSKTKPLRLAVASHREEIILLSRFPALWLPLSLSAFIVIVAILSCSDRDNPVMPTSGPKLTLSLDSTLDRTGNIIVNSISSAILTDTGGTVIKTARTISGRADFDLSQVEPGDYFITINDLTEDRIPTRIISIGGDTIPDMNQHVSRTLVSSVITVNYDTLFKIKTFFRDQDGHPVRKFSDGTNASPEAYAYCILSFRAMPANLEIRIDGSAALLVRELAPHHSHHRFGTWMLGDSNHGIDPAGDPDSTSAQCGGCHQNFDRKPPAWSQISPMNGLCFKCHYGSAGTAAGIIDPAE
jgi:hypothetical protein